jgi:hypothetical protein
MRASEVFFEADILNIFSRRMNSRIAEIWNLAPDNPQRAVADAERLSE